MDEKKNHIDSIYSNLRIDTTRYVVHPLLSTKIHI
jgi:hypothetical protein